MIRDIENKSKKELIEILEIAKKEYQELNLEHKRLKHKLIEANFWRREANFWKKQYNRTKAGAK